MTTLSGMTIRVVLTPQAVDRLDAVAKVRGTDYETAAAKVLSDALTTIPATGRYLVVDPHTLDQLELRLGGGSLLSALDLWAKVDRLAAISYGHVHLDFTPGQLEEIGRRAERLSLTPEQLITRTVKKMEELFFTHLGVGSQG
jgi:hypothetical protein